MLRASISFSRTPTGSSNSRSSGGMAIGTLPELDRTCPANLFDLEDQPLRRAHALGDLGADAQRLLLALHVELEEDPAVAAVAGQQLRQRLEGRPAGGAAREVDHHLARGALLQRRDWQQLGGDDPRRLVVFFELAADE